MANNNEEPIEKQLWKAADKLPKNIDAAEYKHIVLGLILRRYVSYALYVKPALARRSFTSFMLAVADALPVGYRSLLSYWHIRPFPHPFIITPYNPNGRFSIRIMRMGEYGRFPNFTIHNSQFTIHN